MLNENTVGIVLDEELLDTDVKILKSSSIDFYPQNEGERAFYEFTFEFKSVTALKAE